MFLYAVFVSFYLPSSYLVFHLLTPAFPGPSPEYRYLKQGLLLPFPYCNFCYRQSKQHFVALCSWLSIWLYSNLPKAVLFPSRLPTLWAKHALFFAACKIPKALLFCSPLPALWAKQALFFAACRIPLKVLQGSLSHPAGWVMHVTQLGSVSYSDSGGRHDGSTLGFGGSEPACPFTGTWGLTVTHGGISATAGFAICRKITELSNCYVAICFWRVCTTISNNVSMGLGLFQYSFLTFRHLIWNTWEGSYLCL